MTAAEPSQKNETYHLQFFVRKLVTSLAKQKQLFDKNFECEISLVVLTQSARDVSQLQCDLHLLANAAIFLDKETLQAKQVINFISVKKIACHKATAEVKPCKLQKKILTCQLVFPHLAILYERFLKFYAHFLCKHKVE